MTVKFTPILLLSVLKDTLKLPSPSTSPLINSKLIHRKIKLTRNEIAETVTTVLGPTSVEIDVVVAKILRNGTSITGSNSLSTAHLESSGDYKLGGLAHDAVRDATLKYTG